MTSGKVTKKTAPPSPRRHPFRLERLLVIGVAGAFFILPLFILPNTTEYGYTKTILAVVLITILGILWGAIAWRRRTWTLRIPWIAWPFLALVAASLFSLLGATNGRFVVQSLVLLAYFFLLLLIVINVVRERRDVTLLLGSFLASVTLVTLYGLLQYAGVMRGPSTGYGLNQVISTLGNKEYVAGLLAYILLPATILLFRLRSVAARIVVIVLIAFNFGSLMLFEQVGANVALGVSAAILLAGCLIFRPLKPLRRARRWILALLLVLALAYLVEAPSGPLNSVVGLSADETPWLTQVWKENSGAVRTWDWWVGLEMWKSSPWIGVGLGNYKLDFLTYKAQFLATPQGASYGFYIARAAQAHNEYVQVLAELGILGALALAAFLVVLAASLLHRLIQNRDEEDRLDLLLCMAGLAAVVAHALVSFPAHLPASSLAAILCCGIALSPVYGERASKVFSIRGWGLRATVLAFALAGTTASIVAVRDLAANALMRTGTIELQLGQTEQARATLERSLRLDFAPHQTYFYLSTAQALLGDLEAAFQSVERCRTRFVDENMYVLYAELAANVGKYTEAEEAITALLATWPAAEIQVRARYIRAVVTLRQGGAQEATTQLEALVRDAPSFQGARITLGNVLLARGLRDEARVVYTEALAVVERELAAAEARAAASSTMTVSAYGELRSQIAALRSDRDTINERLKTIRGS